MKKIRITISHNADDPSEDIRLAAQVRRDLWAHSPVEIDPDGPRHRTHRDAKRNAYFEFATNFADEVQRVIDKFGHSGHAVATIIDEDDGPECVNCGHIDGPVLPSVCRKCHFRDISACPNCRQEIARQAYLPVSGDLFKCPMCHHRVQFHLQDPVLDPQGHYVQPLVVVEMAEEEAGAF